MSALRSHILYYQNVELLEHIPCHCKSIEYVSSLFFLTLQQKWSASKTKYFVGIRPKVENRGIKVYMGEIFHTLLAKNLKITVPCY